jgi:hypothetical protein
LVDRWKYGKKLQEQQNEPQYDGSFESAKRGASNRVDAAEEK